MQADPINLAKHLTARPSNVSIVSIESEVLTVSVPEVGDFEPFNFSIPPLKVSIILFQLIHNLSTLNLKSKKYYQVKIVLSFTKRCH